MYPGLEAVTQKCNIVWIPKKISLMGDPGQSRQLGQSATLVITFPPMLLAP